MRILITGISGLIGRWTAAAAEADGHEVFGLDLRPVPDGVPCRGFFHGDLLDVRLVERALRESAPEVVVHLAARTDLKETQRLEGYSANIEGVRGLVGVSGAVPSVRRVLYTSSQLVCRIGHIPRTMQEYCPSTLYGESKAWTERIVRETDGAGKEWSLVRPTTVWGPHVGPHYRRMMELIRRGRYFHCGPGALRKSYAYVGNIAYQYVRLMTAPREAVHGRTFYLADYEPLSLRAYADGLARGFGARPIPTYPLSVVRVLARAGDLLNAIGWRSFPFNSFRLGNILTEYIFDLRETEEVCGPLPVGWRDGVSATCRWYLDKVDRASVIGGSR